MSEKLRRFIKSYRGAITPAEKYVLIAMAEYGSNDGSNIYPGVWRIAEDTGYHPRHVQKVLRRIENKKFLITDSKKGGRGHTTRYRIPLEKLAEQPKPAEEPPPPPPSKPPIPDIPTWAREIPPADSGQLPEVSVLELLKKKRSMLDYQQVGLQEAMAKHRPNVDYWIERVKKTQQEIEELEQLLPTDVPVEQ